MSIPSTTTPRQINGSTTELPSDSELLLRNLRFLNLDLLQDWPSLTVDTFHLHKDVQVSRTGRIRSAEWVLYKLFELWNPKECKTKLRAFFPALEPLQSVKIRASFCQWLIQLKTEGALSPECMPRKSLFDECQGAKFVELLMHFSAAVLTKILKEQRQHLPIAQCLALKSALANNDEQSLDGLLCAYLASLQSMLTQKQEFRTQINKEAETITSNSQTLNVKKDKLEANLTFCASKFKHAGIDTRSFKDFLRDECSSESEWLSVIISGDQATSRDHSLEKLFFENSPGVVEDQQPVSRNELAPGLIPNLSSRVATQEARLNDWREFQRQVSKKNEGLIVSRSPGKSPAKSPYKAQARTPVKSPRKRDEGTSVASNSVVRTRSVKNREPLQHVSRKLVFDEKTDTPNRSLGIKPKSNAQVSRPTPQSLGSWTKRQPNGLDEYPLNGMSPKSPSPLRKPPAPLGLHRRAQSDAPASALSNEQAQVMDQAPSEKLQEPKLASPMHSPTSLNNEPSAMSASQTLAERTLQTLQQCKPHTSVHEASNHRKSASVQLPDRSVPPRSTVTSTPDRSRPGTSNTVSSLQGLSSASIRSDTSFGISPPAEQESDSKPAAPSHALQPPSHVTMSASSGDNKASGVAAGGNPVTTNEHVDLARRDVQTPEEMLLAEDVDYASIFKTRSKLRHSPPQTPSQPLADTDLSSPLDGKTRD